MVDKVPTLRDMYYGFEKEVSMDARNMDHPTDAFIEGQTYTSGTGGNDVAHPSKYSKVQVNFYRDSFSSYKHLATVMHHEFIHVGDMINGFYYNKYVENGGEFDENGYSITQTAYSAAVHLSEMRAYHITEAVTGAISTSFSGYQRSKNWLESRGIKY